MGEDTQIPLSSPTVCLVLGNGGEQDGGPLPDVLTLCAADGLQIPPSFCTILRETSEFCSKCNGFLLFGVVFTSGKICFLSFWYSS